MKNKIFDKILRFFRKPTTYQQSKKEREAKPFGNKLTTKQILQAVEQCRKENK